ncbi:MAG: cytochrome c biogenesis protein CcsA [Planctomycetaceae bacterium]|nr:cytochrome c biogenesis protein CcsA [Planctomycetaceae bacterium]
MDGLKRLCLWANIVLTLFAAMVCVIGSMMGAGWCGAFFSTIPGESLLISLALLFVAMVLEFGSARQIYLTIRMWFRWSKKDIIVSVFLLAVVVLIFYSRILPVKSHNLKSIYFVPHIFASLLSYVFFLQAAYFSGKCLLSKNAEMENEAYRLICLGFPLLTAGIIIGSIWAASAWGNWWSWDPKETFSLAVWFVYLAFIIFRKFYGPKFLQLNCLWGIIAFLMIIFGVIIVNFSRIFAGLHSY